MMGINAGLSGVPYWGTDNGGFVPTAEFTAELFVRWFQFGAFCPSFFAVTDAHGNCAGRVGMGYGKLWAVGDGSERGGVSAQTG